jgi:hypothetical protein
LDKIPSKRGDEDKDEIPSKRLIEREGLRKRLRERSREESKNKRGSKKIGKEQIRERVYNRGLSKGKSQNSKVAIPEFLYKGFTKVSKYCY